MLAYSSERIQPITGKKSMAKEVRGATGFQEAERENRKWGQAILPQSSPPGLYFLQEGSNFYNFHNFQKLCYQLEIKCINPQPQGVYFISDQTLTVLMQIRTVT